MTAQLLHNPRCSKSRQALELLGDRDDVTVREYLKEPPTVDELRTIVTMLGVRPIELARRGETTFRELALSDDTPDDEVLRAMSENPILIERPILIVDGRAVIGRPPERVLELL
jgi:arsenate reductase